MATLTTPHGYPYPDDNEPVATGASAIGALAQAIDAAMTPADIESQVTAGAGWQIDALTATKLAGYAILTASITRTGANISGGDIPNETLLSGLPADYLPATDAGAGGAVGGTSGAFLLLRPSGEIWCIAAASPGIGSGQVVSFNAIYPRAL